MTTETGGLAGTPSRMNPLEAMMWRAEVDPRLRSPVTIVDLLDTEPDWDRMVAAHEWATRFVPRLRQRALEPWWGWGTPAWVPDSDFALSYHLRRQRLAGSADRQELLDLAALLAMTPFDRARPPWEATLVTGLEGGRAAYVLKVHHSLADGLGLVQVLGLLHSTRREHDEDKAGFPALPPDEPSRLELTAARAADVIAAIPAAARDGARAGAHRLGRAVTDPIGTIADGGAVLRSVLRAAAPPAATGSPLLRGRSLNRRFASFDVDLDELKAAGRRAGGSLNDAFLAALLGAMRRYHRRFGAVPDRIAVGMPVNIRDRSDPIGGNRWAGTRFAAPVGEPDPLVRIAQVHHIVAAVTGERVVDALGVIAPVLAALPAPLLARVQGSTTRANDLQASNILGFTEPRFLAGAEILASYPFAPLPGGAAMITLSSHQGTCCIGVNLDPAAITDVAGFLDDLRTALDEVLALARTA